MAIPKYQGVLLGVEARGTIAKDKTYRVRHGNGAYGTILGKKYQDTMNYYTPTNPQTEPQQDWRTHFKEQVKEALKLTPEEREPYEERAKQHIGRTWFTQYMSERL